MFNKCFLVIKVETHTTVLYQNFKFSKPYKLPHLFKGKL